METSQIFGLDFGKVGPVSGIYSFISEEHMKFVGDGLVRDIHTSDLPEVILTESKEQMSSGGPVFMGVGDVGPLYVGNIAIYQETLEHAL